MLTDPSIEKLKAKSASPYDLAVLVSKRARQLTDGAQPMVDDTDAANVVSLACREVAADKIVAVEGDVADQVKVPITREEKIQKRMAQAKAEIGRADEFEYLVTNGDLDTAAKEIVAIITAEKLKASKNIDTAKALL
jgi:DNA-directed RNA polymerase omega subunit